MRRCADAQRRDAGRGYFETGVRIYRCILFAFVAKIVHILDDLGPSLITRNSFPQIQ